MRKLFYLLIICTIVITSCSDFLDVLPNKKLAVPKSLQDLQQLLNNSLLYSSGPNTPEILSDDYYVTSVSWRAIADERVRNLYIWQKEEHDSWDRMYRAVYHANVVLDHLDELGGYGAEEEIRNELEGAARFYRALYYYWILQVYALPYEGNEGRPGIPLRNSSDFNEVTTRASVSESYRQIIYDLKKASAFLPVTVLVKTQPSKPAAWGLLARVYLTMSDYENAYKYADSCINYFGYDNLLDFNLSSDVAREANLPFKVMNKEVIFHAMGSSNAIINNNNAKVDSLLYKSYVVDDLRKIAYFRANTGTGLGTYSFKGVYDENANNIFYGLALNEILLIRAESAVRLHDLDEALSDINLLLKKRWKAGAFIPFSSTDSDMVLRLILTERRKELLRRGLRWVDLRRLSPDPVYRSVPVRLIDDDRYELDVSGARAAVLIPYKVIELSQIEQNQ